MIRPRSRSARAIVAACAAGALLSGGPAAGAPRESAPAARPAVKPGRLEVVIINGGGTAASNYQSHLLHVRQLVALLRESGVATKRITVFSSDGADPQPDMALRESHPPLEMWRVAGTPFERRLEHPITFADSTVEGLELRPATQESLDGWFAKRGTKLEDGDTLFLYVTDHGTRNAKDTTDNQITLWGPNESLSVSELRPMLARLDPRVRVVMAMSQCYSGSFAHLLRPEPGPGGVCGYFSTTAERPAYGCYPENRGVDNVGHGFHLMQGIASHAGLAEAHREILKVDATPDVPLRTSDFYLQQMLDRQAALEGRSVEQVVDGLLAEAWKNKAAWEADIRLLDAIGQQFGSFSPRSLAELAEQESRVAELSRQLEAHSEAWKAALRDANRANVDRFLSSNQYWASRVARVGDQEAPGALAPLAAEFLAALASYTRGDRGVAERFESLRVKSEAAAAAAYRMEVRLGVILRMRALLVSVAGRQLVATRGTPEQRAALAGLLACEDLRLPLRTNPLQRANTPATFPALEDELRTARQVLPAWIGIRYEAVDERRRAARHLRKGAASITAVFPDSPAAAAGLEVGDIVLGPPDAYFEDAGQIREWTMRAEFGKPLTLDLLRGKDFQTVTITPGQYPMKWPELPGPPKVSSAAPALDARELVAYRGALPAKQEPYFLFFWATWCGPCKAAVPEVLAFEKERGIPVLAITDEPSETLDTFFGSWDKPFPARVAIDERRRSFVAHGVNGTPTFVLVGGDGIVQAVWTGYGKDKGLAIEGWKWSGPEAPVSAPSPSGRSR